MFRALFLLALFGSSVAVKPKIIASGRGAPDSVNIVNSRVRFRQVHLPLQLNELKNGLLVDGISQKSADVRYRLKNGHAKGRISYGGIFEVWLDEVKWVDDSHVLLSITDFSAGGSSSQAGYVQVAKLDGDWLTITQEIEFDAQSPHWKKVFNPRTRSLVVRGRSAEFAHCCPTAEDETVFRWDGERFVPVKWKRIQIATDEDYRSK